MIRQAIETERAKGNQQFAKEFAKEYTTLFSGDKQPKIAQIDSLVQNYKHEPAFFATTQLFSQLSLAFAAEAGMALENNFCSFAGVYKTNATTTTRARLPRYKQPRQTWTVSSICC